MMFLFILIFSLLGFIILFVANKRVEKRAASVAILFTFLGLCSSIFLFKNFLNQPQSIVFEWVKFKVKVVPLAFQIDNLGLLMLLLVHLIALLIQVYSVSYMKHEVKWRYFAFIQLFIFSMLGIILAGNLIVMYIFWELVGLCSYLLIGYWYEKPRAVWAAKKAFLLNRVGDIGFLAGILLLFSSFPDLLQFKNLYASSPITHSSILTLVGLLLFCGTVGKSAQLPLSAWLPDAMEGPTPVSALIHAATMVAAGVFLLARIYPLLTPTALLVIAVVGTATMLWAAYRALFQVEIKKLLAYSTISQLGLMVMAMGIQAPAASLFHLFTHAFFKAGLFLCAGVILHNLTPSIHNAPLLPVKGKGMRLLFWTYTLCAAALVGLPFTSGFLSKDLILISAFEWAKSQGGLAYLIPILSLLSAGLTAAYMMRQWRMVFDLTSPSPVSEADATAGGIHIEEKVPLVILAVLSVFFWFSINPLNAAHSWLLNLFGFGKLVHGEGFLHTIVPILATIAALIGLAIGYWSTNSKNIFFSLLYKNYTATIAFFEQIPQNIRYCFEILRRYEVEYEQELFLIKPMQKIARFLYFIDLKIVDRIVNIAGYLTVIVAHLVGRFDKIIIDGSVGGMAWLAGFLGNRVRGIQNGKIQSYFVALIIGILIVILAVL